MQNEQITTEIRFLGADDSDELARLAELDTTTPPPSPVLGGIVDGQLVAAHSLATGESIADPFQRTDELRSRLARRAGELDGGDPSRTVRLRNGYERRVDGSTATQPAR